MKSQRFPRDISQYVNLKSPILKYLIEIEKKHWNSDINQAFRLAGRQSFDDSEESIQSLKGVTSYQLASQNSTANARVKSKEQFGGRVGRIKLTLNGGGARDTVNGFKSQPRSQRLEGDFHIMDAKEMTKKRPKKFELVEEELTHVSKPRLGQAEVTGSKINTLNTLKSLRPANSGDINEEFGSSMTWASIKEKPSIQLATKRPGDSSQKLNNFILLDRGTKPKFGDYSTRSPRTLAEKLLQPNYSSSKIRVGPNLQSNSTLKQSGLAGMYSPKRELQNKPQQAFLYTNGSNKKSKLEASFGSRGELKSGGPTIKKLASATTLNALSSQSGHSLISRPKPQISSEKLKTNLTHTDLRQNSTRMQKQPVQLVSLKDKNLLVLKAQALGRPTLQSKPQKPHELTSTFSRQLFNSIRHRLDNH